MSNRIVSVIIPTCGRPFAFARAVRSVFAQRGYGRALEVIAVENDPAGSAIPVFKALEREATAPFFWTHEPRRGLAHARNAGLGLARGTLIAFLDDDQEAPPHWLASLIAVQRETGAGAVFGPVAGVTPPESRTPHRRFFVSLYSRQGPSVSGPLTRPYGVGNALVVRPRLLAGDAPFAPDAPARSRLRDSLFTEATHERFAWAADAVVLEHIRAERLHIGSALAMSFRHGQDEARILAHRGDKARPALAGMMLTGALQAVTATAPAMAALLLRIPGAAQLSRTAAFGAGKAAWFLRRQPRAPVSSETVTKRARRRPRRAAARVPVA